MNAVGIDVGGTKVYCLAEYQGRRYEHRAPTGYACTAPALRDALFAYLDTLPFVPDVLGMAIPGLLEGDDYVARSNVVPGLDAVGADFFSYRGCPVFFIHDLKAGLLGEAEAYKPEETVAVVMAGTGIAAAVRSGGQIYLGSKGWSGELGSCPILVGEEVATLDELSSGAAILRRAGVDAATLRDHLEAGDPDFSALIAMAGRYFGLGLSTFLNLFNPSVLILGGSTVTYPGYLEAAQASLAYTLEEIRSACRIVPAQDPVRMAAKGALTFAQMHG